MADKFLEKYRIDTSRASWWDYSGNGVYFITINTYNRERFLSSIKDGVVYLSECGKIVKSVWEALPDHFNHVLIDEFVVMPDHFHGIITLSNNEGRPEDELQISESKVAYDSESMSLISPVSGSLARVIGNFKSVVTRKARKAVKTFKWQERYFDRIIRNEEGLLAAREYIRSNPLKWNNKV
jgi:REP element-mobilizing transposase RayT